MALCSLVLVAGVLEFAARVVAGNESRVQGGSTSRFDARLGWSNAPGTEQRIRRSDFDVVIRINAQGLRGPERTLAKPPGTRRVLVLGDSFAEGYYVSEEDMAAARLERALLAAGCGPTEVLNGGTAGFSTDQELLLYRLEGRRFAPDLVVVFFFGNDLYYATKPVGTGGRAKPYFDLKSRHEIVLRNVPVPEPPPAPAREPGPPTWRGSAALRLLSDRTSRGNPELHALLARLGLVEPGALDPPLEFIPFCPWNRAERWAVDDMWNRTAAILETLAREVAMDGGRLAVLYVPYRFEANDEAWDLTRRRFRADRTWDRDAVARRLAETCARLGIPLVDPRVALARAEREHPRGAYLPDDGHWNEVGNAVAAAALAPLAARELGCAAPGTSR